MSSEKIELTADIAKIDEAHRVVYGWASVIEKDGEVVEDLQGDVISETELLLATTEFMKAARTAKMMHDGEQIGQVIHSFPLTKDIAKSLGIETDTFGWIVGVHVTDDAVWKAVAVDKSLQAFSIGGQATRKEI